MWPYGRETGASIEPPAARRSLMPEPEAPPAAPPPAAPPPAEAAPIHPPRPLPTAEAPTQPSMPQFQIDTSTAWVHLSNAENKIEFTPGDIAATLRSLGSMLNVSGTIVSNVIAVGRAGPYKAICSIEAAQAFLAEKTIAFVRSGMDDEVEIKVELEPLLRLDASESTDKMRQVPPNERGTTWHSLTKRGI
jgi:hypothetical protein